jgi:catalase
MPINALVAQVHNHQRDGLHRQAIVRGRVAYEPSSLGGGCPHQAGSKAGFTSFPQRVSEDHVRGKPAKFAEHFQQATLFWNSQSPAEQSHIVSAFRFELGKVETIEVRTRVLSQLRNVSDDLAGRVAKGLGMSLPEPMPSALDEAPEPEVTRSPALSLMARPSEIGIATRRVAILVADGVDTEGARAMRSELEARGAVARFVGPRLGEIAGPGRTALAIDTTFDASPAPVWDAVIVADGAGAADALSKDVAVHELLTLTHRHGKPMMFVGSASRVLEASRVPTKLPSGGADAFLLVRPMPTADDDVGALAKVLAKHRTTEREVLV